MVSQSLFQIWLLVSIGFHAAVDNSYTQIMLLILHEGHCYMHFLLYHLFSIPNIYNFSLILSNQRGLM